VAPHLGQPKGKSCPRLKEEEYERLLYIYHQDWLASEPMRVLKLYDVCYLSITTSTLMAIVYCIPFSKNVILCSNVSNYL